MKKTITAIFFLIYSLTLAYGQSTYIPIDYKEYIVGQLSSGKYVSGGEEVARNAASKFIQLYENNSSKFGTYFTFDNVAHTYTINTQNMPSNFRSLNWQGSSSSITSNVWGQYTSKDERYYNTLIMSWTESYLKQYPPITTKGEACWIELFKNVARLNFNDNMDLCFSKWQLIKGIELRKAKLIQYTRECISDYMRVRDKGELNFTDYDQVQNLKNAIETNDWEKIEAAANKMGWTYDTYLNYQ